MLKSALLEHLGHIVSHGCLAGWLRAEARAEAEEARAETRARAEARARVTMGSLTHTHTHSPTLTLCGWAATEKVLLWCLLVLLPILSFCFTLLCFALLYVT